MLFSSWLSYVWLRRLANRSNFAVSLRWRIVRFSGGTLQDGDEDLSPHNLDLEKKERGRNHLGFAPPLRLLKRKSAELPRRIASSIHLSSTCR
jgi:hypothetical protein